MMGALGVLTTEGDSLLPRGYVANPETFDFPIMTEKVEGPHMDRLWARDPSIESAVIVAAERLVKRGAVALASDCGLFSWHQPAVAAAAEETLMLGLRDKVMGQVNLVFAGLNSIGDGGSFTLTSGVLDRDPIRMGTGAAAANGALGGFVLGAAIEMPRGLRINVVSPGLLDVSVLRYGEWFPGHEPVSSKRVGLASPAG